MNPTKHTPHSMAAAETNPTPSQTPQPPFPDLLQAAQGAASLHVASGGHLVHQDGVCGGWGFGGGETGWEV